MVKLEYTVLSRQFAVGLHTVGPRGEELVSKRAESYHVVSVCHGGAGVRPGRQGERCAGYIRLTNAPTPSAACCGCPRRTTRCLRLQTARAATRTCASTSGRRWAAARARRTVLSTPSGTNRYVGALARRFSRTRRGFFNSLKLSSALRAFGC